MSKVKMPPSNLEAEQSVLGGILLEPECIDEVLDYIDHNSFYYPQNRAIFQTLIEMRNEENTAIDCMTLCDKLEKTDRFSAIEGSAYIFNLPNIATTSANIGHHAKIIAEKATQRRIMELGQKITAMGYDGHIDGQDALICQVEATVLDAEEQKRGSNFISLYNAAEKAYYELPEKRNKSSITGVTSGFYELDDLTLGFQKDNLIILGGRPSMGKTAFALNCAFNAAQKGHPAVFISIEMPYNRLALRLMSSDAEVNIMSACRGFTSEQEYQRFGKTVSKFEKIPLYIDSTPNQTPTKILSGVRRLAKKGLCDILFVDYLQLVTPDRRYPTSREREVSEMSRMFKLISGTLNIPVVVLAQLNRSVEDVPAQNGEPRAMPSMRHLRESGSLEQDADLVMFCYRKDYYYPDDMEARGKALIKLAKNRNGPIGQADLGFNATYTQFYNLEQRYVG